MNHDRWIFAGETEDMMQQPTIEERLAILEKQSAERLASLEKEVNELKQELRTGQDALQAGEEQRNDEVSTSEIIRYVYQFAIYALEDSLHDFQQDVRDNQGWTEAQAHQGYEALKRLIVSLQ